MEFKSVNSTDYFNEHFPRGCWQRVDNPYLEKWICDAFNTGFLNAALQKEGQKPTTNTQSAAVAQIADDMGEWVIQHRNKLETPWYSVVCCIQHWCRQLRAL